MLGIYWLPSCDWFSFRPLSPPPVRARPGHVVSVNIWARESNSPVVEGLNKGLMDNPQLGHFFGVRKYLGGESRNSPVAEWLDKGLITSASSPTACPSSENARAQRISRKFPKNFYSPNI
eukprot:4289487-Pyramimonas_sp.AAC.1